MFVTMSSKAQAHRVVSLVIKHAFYCTSSPYLSIRFKFRALQHHKLLQKVRLRHACMTCGRSFYIFPPLVNMSLKKAFQERLLVLAVPFLRH